MEEIACYTHNSKRKGPAPGRHMGKQQGQSQGSSSEGKTRARGFLAVSWGKEQARQGKQASAWIAGISPAASGAEGLFLAVWSQPAGD